MGTNWNQGLMRWKPHVDGAGEFYSLNHLHPFRYEVALPAATVTVSVGFAMHCFTRGSLPDDVPADLYQDERESRTFCHERYILSRKLPELVRALPERACQFARNDNFVTFDTVSPEGELVKYGVFFNLKRWHDGSQVPGVLLTVQSAYPINPLKSSPGRGKVGFIRAVDLIMQGTKPRPPKP